MCEVKGGSSGEREWWDKLQLRLPEQSDCYLHVAPPEFVSRKKHIIKSYLMSDMILDVGSYLDSQDENV